jgi:proteic killer suppression protein
MWLLGIGFDASCIVEYAMSKSEKSEYGYDFCSRRVAGHAVACTQQKPPQAARRLRATGDGRRLGVQNTRRIANILRALDDASRPEDMNLPGFRFRALVGRDKGRYAVNASGNWRITFGWLEGDAIDADLEDYH